nr:hypothetical protein [Haloprofundus halophilus]
MDTVVTAVTYVEDYGFTPFDALHLVESDGATIVSSDETYESFAPRLDVNNPAHGGAGLVSVLGL